MSRASSHEDESTKPLLERNRNNSEGDEEEALHAADPRRFWVLCVYVVLVTHQVGGMPLLLLLGVRCMATYNHELTFSLLSIELVYRKKENLCE